jgi:hypothetical protein
LAAQEYDPAIPTGQIREHPKNPNEGDMGLLERSMSAHRDHRFREAVSKGAPAPGHWLEVDDDGAEEIMAMDNESTRRGENNRAKLLALLQPMDDARLARAGFIATDVADLVALLHAPDLGELARGAPAEEDMWPMLRFRVSPADRERFYEVTDPAEDKSDTGRLVYLLDAAGQ